MKLHPSCARLLWCLLSLSFVTSCSRSPKKLETIAKPQVTPATATKSVTPPAQAVIAVAQPPEAPPSNARMPDRILASGHTAPVVAAALSPDQKVVATGSDDKTIRIWDVSSGRSLRVLTANTDAVTSLAFSPDGKRLVSAGRDGNARVWNVEDGSLAYEITSARMLLDVLFSPDSQTLVISAADKDEGADHAAEDEEVATGGAAVEIRSAADGKLLREIKVEWNGVRPLVVTGDGRIIGAGGAGEDAELDVATRIWDIKTGKELNSFPVFAQAISSDGRWLASEGPSGQERTIVLRDTQSGATRVMANSGLFYNLSFVRGGAYLVGANPQGSIQLWDVSTGKEVTSVPIRSNGQHVFAFSPYSTTLWDLSEGQKSAHSWSQPSSGFIAFDQTGRLLVSLETGLQVWDPASWKEITEHPVVVGGSISISHDGKWLESNPKGVVHVWDSQTWKAADLLPDHSAYIWSSRFVSPQLAPHIANTSVAASGVKSWQVASNQTAPALVGYTYAMAVSPDEKLLVLGHARGGEVEIWDLVSGTKLTSFTAHKLSVTQLEFSPDGKSLLTAGQEAPINIAAIRTGSFHVDSNVKLWDVDSWQGNSSFSSHGLGLSRGFFSRDGKILALQKGQGTIDLFDLSRGVVLTQLGYQDFASSDPAFSPDGKWLALYTRQGVAVWNVVRESTQQQ